MLSTNVIINFTYDLIRLSYYAIKKVKNSGIHKLFKIIHLQEWNGPEWNKMNHGQVLIWRLFCFIVS